MDTVEILKSHDVKPTIVRIKVYDYLTRKKNHPTADIVYKKLIKEIPTLSKTSIYNTMDLFLDRDLVQAITIEENETRYDADISEHGHFKCSSCGSVYDFSFSLPDISYALPKDFIIKDRQLYFLGLCPECSR